MAQRTDVYEIGFNAKSIFYTGGGNLRRIDRESGTDTQLSSQVNVLSVAAADDYIYFATTPTAKAPTARSTAGAKVMARS